MLVVGLVTCCADLRALTQTGALDSASFQAAVDWGRSNDPEPYLIYQAANDRRGTGTSRIIVGAVYTPFVRVALAARAARHADRALSPSDIPEWLIAPVVHIAVRWHTGCALAPGASHPNVEIVPEGARLGGPQGPGGLRPLGESPGVEALVSLGGTPAFSDASQVVTYPLSVLTQDVDVIVFNRGAEDRLCFERGRLTRGQTQTWR
jgi:hypothetical protein